MADAAERRRVIVSARLSNMPSKSRSAEKGVTLIELLIAMGVLGILAAIAIPSYQDVTQKARRHDAEDALMGLRQAMERHYARIGSYEGAANDAGVPQIFATQTPIEGSGHYYDLKISSITDARYELVATPTAVQLRDPCGTLRLNQAGQRGSALTDGQCWNGAMPYP